jgi:hypothetical protein
LTNLHDFVYHIPGLWLQALYKCTTVWL